MATLPKFAQPGSANCTVHWHVQPLDHFNYAETRIMRQRYFTYAGYFTPTSNNILFYTGNEANVELYVNATGLMWERARELSALLVFSEHRYYGESLPFGAASGDNASTLRWLSMEQALADHATLLYSLKRSLAPRAARAVAIGGSYGGMLAAWLRLKYPSAVVGVLAASAPVLAFGGLWQRESASYGGAWDGGTYWQVVTRDATPAAGATAACAPAVRASWGVLERWVQARGKELQEALGLCAPVKPDELSRVRGMMLNVWDTLAMGNFPYASNYLVFQQTQDPSVKLPPWPVRVACAHFDGVDVADEAALLRAVGAAAGVLYNASERTQCLELPTGPSFDGIWDYQWCTERLPQETYFSLNGTSDMFWPAPSNQTAITAHCAAKYDGLAQRPEWVAQSAALDGAGGVAASNIIFSNGEYDPWRSGGVLRNLSSTLVAIEVPQGAHHLDLFFSTPDDPPTLARVRDAEVALLRRWLDANGE
jgi:lysosomal Pro-X carboxypeptidase